MATLESFERTLKEVVNAKRLSASKVEKLTGIALQLMENDTQLVSTLYRTHKGLSGASKINSLYAFDALARAARSQVNKQNLDVHAITGNSATFLVKVEGVLDGLFQDMVSSGHPDAKEKSKKILDIWLKSNTFPAGVLSRLSKVVQAEKDPDTMPAVPIDPRSAQPQVTATVPPVADAVQSTLLALLSKAAAVVQPTSSTPNGQIGPNIANLNLPSGSSPPPPPPPSLAGQAPQAPPAAQLALLQQLTQAAQAGPNVPSQRVPVSVPVVPSSAPANELPPVAPPVGGPSQNLSYRDDRNGYARREPQYDRYNHPSRGREHYHDRQRGDFRNNHYNGDYRGGPRGGFRGRGRGRWEDNRERQFERGRDHHWNDPPPRNIRSRSRSPAGRNGRDIRPHSPPRRPPYRQPSPRSPPRSTSVPSTHPDKDEFGRDIRPQPPNEHGSASASNAPELSPSRSASILTEDRGSSLQDGSQHDQIRTVTTHSMPPATPPPPSDPMPSGAAIAGVGAGLESFNLASFNPTDPTSWEALGKAWNVTNGYAPSQEELMQYTMSVNSANPMNSIVPVNAATKTFPIPTYDEEPSPHRPVQAQDWNGGQRGAWRGRGRGRGRGRDRDEGQGGHFSHGYEYGNGREGFRGGNPFEQETDALTLVGGDGSLPYNATMDYQVPLPSTSHDDSQDLHADRSVGAGGKMQKVGDRWVFVRGQAAEVA